MVYIFLDADSWFFQRWQSRRHRGTEWGIIHVHACAQIINVTVNTYIHLYQVWYSVFISFELYSKRCNFMQSFTIFFFPYILYWPFSLHIVLIHDVLLGSSTCNGGHDILDARGWPGMYISFYKHGRLLELLVKN